MSIIEVFVIIIAAIVGYFFVNGLIPQKQENKDSKPFEPWQDHPFSNETNTAYDESYIERHWYEILEIPSNAKRADIAVAYKKKLAQYHSANNADSSSESREVAEQHIKQINAAYKYAMLIKGFNDL